MHTAGWQVSSYCAEGNSCLALSPAPGHAIRLRESADPAAVLTTTPTRLAALLAAVKHDGLDPHSPPATT